MRLRSVRHGCLALVVTIGLTAFARGESRARVPAQVFEIQYTVNETALPLDSVQLWYTLDKGQAWHQYGFDEDCQSPFTFHAPAEGLFGFYLCVANKTGASSPPPGPSTPPHQWAFVDYTPPVVQLHPLRQSTMLGQRVLQIRWTAIDAHLTSRPVEVEYRRLPAAEWHPVTPDPLANTGRYDWRIPEGLAGPMAVRAFVSDDGGHRVASEAQVIELTNPTPPAALPPSSSGLSGNLRGRTADGPTPTASNQTRIRARQLFEEGLSLRDRGDYRRGIARFREVVRLDPQMTDAFAEMGGMLYLLGDFDRALAAYEVALGQQPVMRAALQGALADHPSLQPQ